MYVMVAYAHLEIAARGYDEACAEAQAWFEDGNPTGYTFHPIARRWVNKAKWRRLNPFSDLPMRRVPGINQIGRIHSWNTDVFTAAVLVWDEVVAHDGAEAAYALAQIIRQGATNMFLRIVSRRPSSLRIEEGNEAEHFFDPVSWIVAFNSEF